jgi:hypothetical protein
LAIQRHPLEHSIHQLNRPSQLPLTETKKMMMRQRNRKKKRIVKKDMRVVHAYAGFDDKGIQLQVII